MLELIQNLIHTTTVFWAAQSWFWMLLWCVAAGFCVCWWFRIPSPGKAVAAMGVVAAITALQGEMHAWQKVLWLVALFVLLVIEIRAIDKDRTTHDNEQSQIRMQEQIKFQHIADGLTAAIAGINTTIHGITGGNTFCYLEIFGEQVPLITTNIRKHGGDPLYDVTMKLQVMIPVDGTPGQSTGSGAVKYNLGNITAAEKPAFHEIPLAPFNLAGKEKVDFYAAFSAKNGFWHQIMYFRRVGGLVSGGRWLKATKVYKVDYGSEPYKQAKSECILEKIDKDFPMEGIAWNDLLLYDH